MRRTVRINAGNQRKSQMMLAELGRKVRAKVPRMPAVNARSRMEEGRGGMESGSGCMGKGYATGTLSAIIIWGRIMGGEE